MHRSCSSSACGCGRCCADLRVLTEAAQKFATDYREPLDTAKHTTQLTSLATNLDDMSAQA